VFNRPKYFGAGSKDVQMLEPELDTKTLDAWSWSQSLKFQFELHSPWLRAQWRVDNSTFNN